MARQADRSAAAIRLILDTARVLFGQNRWVLDYVMVLGSPGKTARVAMVDVIDVNAGGEVTRNEAFLKAAEAQAALAKAGLA